MTKVQLMVTCLIDATSPEAAECVVEVLEKAGVEIEVPRARPAAASRPSTAASGTRRAAMAKHTIEVFGDSDLPVVIPSGSCADMIAHHYPELFEGDPVWYPRAEKLSQRTCEFTQYPGGRARDHRRRRRPTTASSPTTPPATCFAA